MPLILNSAKKRFELTSADGRVLAVMPLPGGDVSDVDPSLVGHPTPTMLANAQKYLAGDEAAGDALEDELDGYNATLAPQQPQQGQGQSQEGLLPTPEYLNAGVDILRSANSAADAKQKLDIKQRDLDRAYQKLGITIDWNSLLVNPEAGRTGPFAASMPAIAEIAATDPEYLRAFGGIQNAAIVAELNRKQNILAEKELELQGAGEQRAKNKSADDLQRGLQNLERDTQRAVQKMIAQNPRATQSDVDQMWRDAEVEREELLNDLWTTMYEANPARAVSYFRDIVPGLTHQQPSIAVGKEIDPVRTYGGRDQFGNAVGKDGPETGNQPKLVADGTFTPPPVAPLPDAPPGPAPEGQRWVKENGAWVLKPAREKEELGTAAAAGFKGGMLPLPGFAEGGVFSGGTFTQSGSAPGATGANQYGYPHQPRGRVAADAGPVTEFEDIAREKQMAIQEIQNELTQTLTALDQELANARLAAQERMNSISASLSQELQQLRETRGARRIDSYGRAGLLPMPVRGG